MLKLNQELLNKMIDNEKKAKDFKLQKDMAKITEQMFKTKTPETNQETNKIEYVKITKEELEQLKTELEETKIELEKTKAELEETKAKLEEQHIIVNDIIENNEKEKEENAALLMERDCEIDKLNNELKEYRPRSDFIELPIYGYSVNDMYRYTTPYYNEKGDLIDRKRKTAYIDWINAFDKELDKIGINELKKRLNLDSIDFNKPLQLNIVYGLHWDGDLDNVQKSFQDRLFKYLEKHGYKSDDKLIHRLILEKKTVNNRHNRTISFSLFNK